MAYRWRSSRTVAPGRSFATLRWTRNSSYSKSRSTGANLVIINVGIAANQAFAPDEMTPLWIFPIYPFLLVGPQAAVFCSSIDPARTLDVAIAGSIFQGLGFMISFMIDGILIYRFMTQKLPRQGQRPSLFISVGPAGFTATSILILSDELQRILTGHLPKQSEASATLVVALIGKWIGVILWG